MGLIGDSSKSDDDEREKAWLDHEGGLIIEGVGDKITDWGLADED